MIDAISLLEKKRDDLMFVVLGEGKHYKKFVTYARKKGVSAMIANIESCIDEKMLEKNS